MERVWCGKYSQVCVQWGENADSIERVKSESLGVDTGLQPWVYDLWREYGWTCEEIWMCLSVDEVKGAARGQVLILKQGCLSWSRPTVTAAPLVICLGHSHQVRLESWAHTPPPWWPPGASRAGLMHRMSSQHRPDWSRAFYFNSVFSLFAALLLPLSLSFSPCPFAPQKTAGVLHGCQEKEGPRLFHCLCLSVSCTWINMGWAERLY